MVHEVTNKDERQLVYRNSGSDSQVSVTSVVTFVTHVTRAAV